MCIRDRFAVLFAMADEAVSSGSHFFCQNTFMYPDVFLDYSIMHDDRILDLSTFFHCHAKKQYGILHCPMNLDVYKRQG